uniref:hypothetical protein n=1 Tax=Thermococcus celericrescens TaxID=227598 RepID=UPI00373FC6E9
MRRLPLAGDEVPGPAEVDPPRKGLKEASELLIKSGVERIVYVSCNPGAFKLDYENHLKRVYRSRTRFWPICFPTRPR